VGLDPHLLGDVLDGGELADEAFSLKLFKRLSQGIVLEVKSPLDVLLPGALGTGSVNNLIYQDLVMTTELFVPIGS
jgi:hypothetical protein